ncbi:MAG: hypothetical protein ACYDCK_14600 [Thermoplasmatota archaeon]
MKMETIAVIAAGVGVVATVIYIAFGLRILRLFDHKRETNQKK